MARLQKGTIISQRKYTIDLLKETGMLGCKPASTPIDSKMKLGREEKGIPVDKGRYQHLVGRLVYLSWRLIYLSHTQPDIGFAVSVVSQFMNHPMEEHMAVCTEFSGI